MKNSEKLRIWIGDTKPQKEVKSWMDRLDRLEEQDFETAYWEAQQHIDMCYREYTLDDYRYLAEDFYAQTFKNIMQFGTQEFTDAAYKQYLASLEEQERRENETE
jgi:hypothetical protein